MLVVSHGKLFYVNLFKINVWKEKYDPYIFNLMVYVHNVWPGNQFQLSCVRIVIWNEMSDCWVIKRFKDTESIKKYYGGNLERITTVKNKML